METSRILSRNNRYVFNSKWEYEIMITKILAVVRLEYKNSEVSIINLAELAVNNIYYNMIGISNFIDKTADSSKKVKTSC